MSLSPFTHHHRDAVDLWTAAPRTVVLSPGIALGELARQEDPCLSHYEERYLYAMGGVQHPDSRLIAVISDAAHPDSLSSFAAAAARAIGLSPEQLRQRVTLVPTPTLPGQTCTEGLLASPETLALVRGALAAAPASNPAWLEGWVVSAAEREAARALGLPLFGPTPAAMEAGSKSGARRLFARHGIPHPMGVEDITSLADARLAMADIFRRSPTSICFVKPNREAGGDGILRVPRHIGAVNAEGALRDWLLENGVDPDHIDKNLRCDGGIVEEAIEGEGWASPSSQLVIWPGGEVQLLSTHDQLLEGNTYLGGRYPAHSRDRRSTMDIGLAVGEAFASMGGLGCFAIDTVVATGPNGQRRSWAIEINARKGGGTHGFMWVRLLTGATLHPRHHTLVTAAGRPVRYRTGEHVGEQLDLIGIEPGVLLDRLDQAQLRYDPDTASGLFVHMLSALPTQGVIGCTAIGATDAQVDHLWEQLMDTLQRLSQERD